jgi:hypothetical protein
VEREGRQAHPNYSSGEDYILEFRTFRYGFNSIDFRQRVEMAAVQLELVGVGGLDEDECSDLVQLVASGSLEFPVSPFGDYLVERGEDVLRHKGECLIYWLRELLFRGAWLDLRFLGGELEVVFEEKKGGLLYYPTGHRGREIGPPPHPSWKEVAYTRRLPE